MKRKHMLCPECIDGFFTKEEPAKQIGEKIERRNLWLKWLSLTSMLAVAFALVVYGVQNDEKVWSIAARLLIIWEYYYRRYKQKNERTKIQLEISQDMTAKLDQLVCLTGVSTRDDALRRKISIFAVLLEEEKAGNRIELVGQNTKMRLIIT